MHEIEVKYQVTDTEALLLALKARGVELGEAVYQDDQAYAPVGWEFGDSKLGVSFVRLRTVGGRHFFALKRPTLNAQSCLEYETELADREEMHQAIRRMGFSPTVRVAKIRRSGKLGEIAVCVDELDGVGTFLELERLVSAEESAAAVQDELASFVTELGVEAERTEETYDTLVQRT